MSLRRAHPHFPFLQLSQNPIIVHMDIYNFGHLYPFLDPKAFDLDPSLQRLKTISYLLSGA